MLAKFNAIIDSIILFMFFKSTIAQEERHLIRELGKEYEHYRNSVGALLPENINLLRLVNRRKKDKEY